MIHMMHALPEFWRVHKSHNSWKFLFPMEAEKCTFFLTTSAPVRFVCCWSSPISISLENYVCHYIHSWGSPHRTKLISLTIIDYHKQIKASSSFSLTVVYRFINPNSKETALPVYCVHTLHEHAYVCGILPIARARRALSSCIYYDL